MRYVQGDFTSPASDAYATLREKITKVQAERYIPDNFLFHLSTPPSFTAKSPKNYLTRRCSRATTAGAAPSSKSPSGMMRHRRAPWIALLSLIDEEHLYRIDHFLGKETVQNMLVFRFSQPGFEPIWNRNYIDHVQITAAESGGIDSRAGDYETRGWCAKCCRITSCSCCA